MEFKFTIDLERMKELNYEKGDFLFKYLKNVSKNKTPIIMKGKKENNYWNCDFYECAIPVSHFTNVKIPADSDKNVDGANLTILLTEKIISQFIDKTDFTFKDSEVNIKRANTRVRDSYKSTIQSLEDQLADFSNILFAKDTKAKIVLNLDKSSELINLLKELRSSPDASIYVNKDSITLRNDSVFLRTKNTNLLEASEEELYINMYLANKILNYLEFCETIKLTQTDTNTIIVVGYDKDNLELVRNVSAVFEASMENPSDEDLASITPDESTAFTVSLDLQSFIENLDNQKALINTFINSKNLEAKLLKNGNGLSLGFETSNVTADKTMITMNIDPVENEEPLDSEFTDYSTVLPINLFKTVAGDNLNLKIVFDKTEETAVLFETGSYKILSGKLI